MIPKIREALDGEKFDRMTLDQLEVTKQTLEPVAKIYLDVQRRIDAMK